MQATLIDVIEVSNKLGEGIIWDPVEGAVWWTDIPSCHLYRYVLESKCLDRWDTPERLCSFGFVADSNRLIAAFESGFAYFDPVSGGVEWLHAVEKDNPATRLNDGRVDRQGRFWAGSMVESDRENAEKGALYCLDRQLNCARKFAGISISNSLCWSPDSTILYHTDTPTNRIDRYDFDAESADVSRRTSFVETEQDAFPDGSIVDAEGFLWNAQWGANQVVRYSPTGAVDFILPVAASQVTCATFAGPDLNLLFVTSATEGMTESALAAEPQAGHVFVYETSAKGLQENRFRPDRLSLE